MNANLIKALKHDLDKAIKPITAWFQESRVIRVLIVRLQLFWRSTFLHELVSSTDGRVYRGLLETVFDLLTALLYTWPKRFFIVLNRIYRSVIIRDFIRRSIVIVRFYVKQVYTHTSNTIYYYIPTDLGSMFYFHMTSHYSIDFINTMSHTLTTIDTALTEAYNYARSPRLNIFWSVASFLIVLPIVEVLAGFIFLICSPIIFIYVVFYRFCCFYGFSVKINRLLQFISVEFEDFILMLVVLLILPLAVVCFFGTIVYRIGSFLTDSFLVSNRTDSATASVKLSSVVKINFGILSFYWVFLVFILYIEFVDSWIQLFNGVVHWSQYPIHVKQYWSKPEDIQGKWSRDLIYRYFYDPLG